MTKMYKFVQLAMQQIKRLRLIQITFSKKMYLVTKHSESAVLMCFVKHLLKTKFQRNGIF